VKLISNVSRTCMIHIARIYVRHITHKNESCHIPAAGKTHLDKCLLDA